jgi:hypothetical protein
LTLREEHSPKVFEKRVQRRIYEYVPKRDEVIEVWRKLHSEKFHISAK